MKFLTLFLIFTFGVANSQDWQKYIQESNALLKQRDFDSALEKAKLAYDDITRVYGDSSQFHINIFGLMGRIYFYSGNYDNAIESYEAEKSLILRFRGNEDLNYARAINNLSVVFSSIGRNSEVEPLLKESIEIKRKVMGENDTSYAKSLNNLGQYYFTRGEYPEAEKLLLKALEIKKMQLNQDDPSTGLTNMNLGMLYEGLGNRDLAIEYLETALSIMKKSLPADHPDRTTTSFQLASLYVLTDQNEKADKLTKENSAINMSGEMTVEKANSIYNYSQLQIRLGNFDLATGALQEALPSVKQKLGMTHPLYSKMIKALGITRWVNNQLEEAYDIFMENLEITRQLYGEKNIQFASALHNVAGLLKALEEYDEADKAYFQAFDIYFYQLENYFPYFSEAEKTKFYRMMKERFDMFNSYVLVRYQDSPEILNKMYDYHIKTKGILLDYSKGMSSSVEQSGSEELKKKYKKLVNLKESLSELYNRNQLELKQLGVDMEKIEKETNDLEKEISLALSKTVKNVKKDFNWKDIQSKLKPNEAAIEIIRFNFYTKTNVDSTIYLALILDSETINNPEILLLENAEYMDGFGLKAYKKTIKAKFPDFKSFNVYWKSIDEKIQGKDRIYLSADGVYNLINISSLRKSSDYYVLDDYTIINLNNTKELLFDNNPVDKTNISTFIGNPTYELEDREKVIMQVGETDKNNQILIAPLPGTEIEVQKISELFNNANRKINKFTQEKATEENFKNIKAPYILHIATHGYFLGDLSEIEGDNVFGVDVEKAVQNPLLRSGLLLSGASNFLNFDASQASGDNGILTAYEVKNMDFRGTDLVVMSACETGLGEVMNGEGVYGLQRSFQVAGANSIIMSLWTVDDKTTQELMVEFYTRYLQGVEKIEAFRQARLVIKEKYQEPYYWGAFKLLGKQ